MSRNYFIMRQQLKDFGVELSDNASDNEIKEKFYNLPITEGQIIELKKLGVSYKAKMQWTRGFAKDFIRKGTQHFRARGHEFWRGSKDYLQPSARGKAA